MWIFSANSSSFGWDCFSFYPDFSSSLAIKFRDLLPPGSHQIAARPCLRWRLPLPLHFHFQTPMTWFLRHIYCRRWISSCSGVARRPDSPVPPSAWAIRDYIQQDALLSQGREPEGSGGGRAFLQRRPREAFLWPPRDWPWQLRRCLLCTAHRTLHHIQKFTKKANTL